MVDYEKVDKLVENCKQLYPDIPDYGWYFFFPQK